MTTDARTALIDRRAWLGGSAAALLAPSRCNAASPTTDGKVGSPIYLADMHYHLFFGVGRKPAHAQPLGPNMAKGQATLVSWSLVGDMPWLRLASGSFKQNGAPSKGDAPKWLREEIGRAKAHVSDNGLALVRSPADIVAAVNGRPHVVFSVEGATFADDGLAQLQAAYELGVRHLQLVHFIGNSIGDMQTEPARYRGLAGYGREVVAECNRLGILIDLAHCTEASVYQILEASKAPVVWSHSSVAFWRFKLPTFASYKLRQLSPAAAKAIASAGGVVGVWALGNDVGTTPNSYADRVLEIADSIGEDHVAFGTDMNALTQPAVSTFSDLRSAVTLMQRRGIDEARIRKIAIGNYARVLTTAMSTRV